MNQQAPLKSGRVAVVGSGISGLACAWLLQQRYDVTLFEREGRLGGHSNTAVADYDGHAMPVDTGFIVFNAPNYPNLLGLFAELGVATENSDMSFAVSVGNGALEWSGSTIATLFAQKRNLLSPRFHRMWLDILRFNKEAPRDWAAGRLDGKSLGDYIDAGRYSETFRLDYLLPMGAAIWSSPMADMLAFPARTFVRFFMNHGLLSVNDRPQWQTVSGGSREYVRRIGERLGNAIRLNAPVVEVRRAAQGATVRTADGTTERFDHVVLAAHGDQSLAMLKDVDAEEREILSGFRFQPNRAILHRDANLMPKRRGVWASWNYLSEPRRDLQRRVGLTYWMNRLQNLDPARPLFVTLNPLEPPNPKLVFASFDYDHPLFDATAIAMQRRLPAIQGRGGIWYAGAWSGYGFHEDGLSSGIAVAEALGAKRPWKAQGNSDIHPMPALKPVVPA